MFFFFSDSEDALNEILEESPLSIDLPKLPEDPFLSPYLASDDLFKQLPPVHIMVHLKICYFILVVKCLYYWLKIFKKYFVLVKFITQSSLILYLLDTYTCLDLYIIYMILQTVDMDPCLDDCVMFAKRLKSLEKKINMDILKGLPHGFLNLAIVSE